MGWKLSGVKQGRGRPFSPTFTTLKVRRKTCCEQLGYTRTIYFLLDLLKVKRNAQN